MRGLIKFFTGLGALILLLVGVGLLALTIYGYINSSVFLGSDSQNLVLGIMLGVSIAIIGGSGEGLYGICKERPKLICAFQILVILFMIIFFGAAAGIVYLPDAFFNGGCADSTNVVITYANNIYKSSQKFYCIDLGCQCSLDTSQSALTNSGYNATEIAFIQTTYNNTDTGLGAHSTADCTVVKNNLTAVENALFKTVGELESLLKCSDWCKDGIERNLIYRFNDVNSGKPEDFCYDRLFTFFNDFSYYGKIGFFTGGAVLFVMFACNMYLCCSPKRRKRKHMKERFMLVVESGDDDDGYYHRWVIRQYTIIIIFWEIFRAWLILLPSNL